MGMYVLQRVICFVIKFIGFLVLKFDSPNEQLLTVFDGSTPSGCGVTFGMMCGGCSCRMD